MIDCENCERPFEPVTSRWLCPHCKWKADCCTGAPQPENGHVTFAETPETEDSTPSTATTSGTTMPLPRRTVTVVHDRAQRRCERCGTADALRWSLHHRKPRGMGGSKDPMMSSPANILLLCGSGTEGCHGWVESHRTSAYDAGLLLHRNEDPTEFPVTLRYGTVFLDDEGGVYQC